MTVTVHSPSLVAGLRIGGYELVRRIGRGGMAEVWCAKRVSGRRTSKFVAIKVIADQHVGDSRYQRMFRTEAELSGLLSHANIVQVFDEGEEDGRSYLVMEWVDGVNLLKVATALTYMDDEPGKHRIISYVVGQLLYALGYAHGITLHDGHPLGLVHRDVSPQNVLVSNHGEVKLTDFGVAHHVLEESSGLHVKGKVRYMAPEQLGGHGRDHRLDLYAVGAILHELLDGRRFRYDVVDQREMLIEVLSGTVPALGRPVPPELDALRRALLRPDPSARPPSAEAALELLERFAGYGDARRELKQLCVGLTGVIRPRVGPGTSEAYVSAPEGPPSPAPSVTPSPAPSVAPSPAPSVAPTSDEVESTLPQPPRYPSALPRSSPAEPEGPPSLTLRMSPGVAGAPQPIVGDTSPLPPPSPWPREPEVTGDEGNGVVAGSGALEVSADPSSPGSTEVVARPRPRGTSVALLLSFLLGSAGMLGVSFVWGDALEQTARSVEGRAREDAAEQRKRAPEEPEEVAVRSPGPELAGPSAPELAGSTSNGDATAGEPGSETSGAPDELDGGTSSTGAEPPLDPGPGSGSTSAPSAPEPTTTPAREPVRQPSRPKERSGLIVAVDGAEPLLVRVGGAKPVTIESRKSWTFRVPVGRRKVQWKRKADTSWSSHRVDVRAKCELQLRVPSTKTMTIGTCN